MNDTSKKENFHIPLFDPSLSLLIKRKEFSFTRPYQNFNCSQNYFLEICINTQNNNNIAYLCANIVQCTHKSHQFSFWDRSNCMFSKIIFDNISDCYIRTSLCFS